MNLPIKIPENKKAKFLEVVKTFQNDLRNIDELSYAWLEGFCNYLLEILSKFVYRREAHPNLK